MIIDSFYTLIGQAVVFLAILIIILFLVIIILGVLLARKNKIKFPRFILFVVDSLYFPFKSIANFLKLDEYLIDDIAI